MPCKYVCTIAHAHAKWLHFDKSVFISISTAILAIVHWVLSKDQINIHFWIYKWLTNHSRWFFGEKNFEMYGFKGKWDFSRKMNKMTNNQCICIWNERQQIPVSYAERDDFNGSFHVILNRNVIWIENCVKFLSKLIRNHSECVRNRLTFELIRLKRFADKLRMHSIQFMCNIWE